MTLDGNYRVPRLVAGFITLALVLCSVHVYSADQVVTYVKHNGNFIELTDSWFPGKTSISGAQMAIEDDQIATRANRNRPVSPALAIHAWTRDGDDFIVHFIRAGYVKRFRPDEVETTVVDRTPATGPAESFFQPDLA